MSDVFLPKQVNLSLPRSDRLLEYAANVAFSRLAQNLKTGAVIRINTCRATPTAARHLLTETSASPQVRIGYFTA
jgi:hypothetical protein